MKHYGRAFRVEIIWTLLLLALALAVPTTLYSDQDEKCYNAFTWPPCDDGDCGCDLDSGPLN